MSDIIHRREKFQQGWHGGLPETPCGAGSRLRDTEKQRQWIPGIIEKYGVQSIADIGAGDLNWIKKTDLKGASYIAFDLVPRNAHVKAFDLVQEVPPAVDMIMCLWVLNHLPYDDCLMALKNLKASGAKYLLMTDRPKWHHEQPEEIRMAALESIVIRPQTGDILKLVALNNC